MKKTSEELLSRAGELAQNEKPPLIRQINNSAHPEAIRLGLGELQYGVDQKVLDILRNPEPNYFRYCPNPGITELRGAVAETFGKEYDENNVSITIGVQEAFFDTLFTLKKLGAKKVLIPEIYFGIYKKIPLDLGLSVETFELTDNFKPDFSKLSIKLKTYEPDVIILNSPANPTGAVLSPEENMKLAEIFVQNGEPLVISDEIYKKLTFDGEPESFFQSYQNAIVVDGISKSGASAGLRVGWIFTKNTDLQKLIIGTGTTIKSSPPTLNQYAALPIVKGETNETIQGYVRQLKENYTIVKNSLRQSNIDFVPSEGGFYAFPDVSEYVGKDSEAFCRFTATRKDGVVVIPGKAFGKPSHIRISFASNQIEEGMKRLIRLLSEYKFISEHT